MYFQLEADVFWLSRTDVLHYCVSVCAYGSGCVAGRRGQGPEGKESASFPISSPPGSSGQAAEPRGTELQPLPLGGEPGAHLPISMRHGLRFPVAGNRRLIGLFPLSEPLSTGTVTLRLRVHIGALF